jgi:hypothetical protein
MKKAVITLLVGMASITVWGQDITGAWNGALKVQGIQLRLVCNLFIRGIGSV